ncbi:ADP compounds hydrolase NudE [Teredinibacter haidensis]|uniref:ADP compounds hydrolase NudE n=1 Tax=Teredinibacter haidensis TaxID=2731755 RepID=UPI000948BB63|nr:ADP compounds hydrolase NudE [Teredinibacter haidensis]
MPVKPQILKCQKVARSRLFCVEQVELRFSNGAERTYERLASGDHAAVIIVPMLDDDRVLLIREYGVGVEDYALGLPKGRVEQGEDSLLAANRELMEEVGYGAKILRPLKLVSQSPSYMQHHTQIVLAQDLYPQTAEGDEPEPLEVEVYRLSELDKLIMREDFSEARSIAALYMARDILANDHQS